MSFLGSVWFLLNNFGCQFCCIVMKKIEHAITRKERQDTAQFQHFSQTSWTGCYWMSSTVKLMNNSINLIPFTRFIGDPSYIHVHLYVKERWYFICQVLIILWYTLKQVYCMIKEKYMTKHIHIYMYTSLMKNKDIL